MKTKIKLKKKFVESLISLLPGFKAFRLISFIGLTVLTVLIASPAKASAAPRDAFVEATFGATKYVLNEKPLRQDTLVYNGVAYLPAAYFVRELGLDALWDPITNNTYITYAFRASEGPDVGIVSNVPVTKRINVTFGAPTYYLNGKELEQESLTYNGTAYLPAGFFAKALGLSAYWDPATNITSVSSIPVEQVYFNDGEILVGRNKTVQLYPKIVPANPTFNSLRYSSSDESVASVSELGEVYAKSIGKAVITCTATNGVTGQIVVRVSVPVVTEVSINPERLRYHVGETAWWLVDVYPEDAVDKNYQVNIDNTKIAALTGNSMRCLDSGLVTVTVTASNGTKASTQIEIINLDGYASEVIRRINDERKKNNLNPLSENQALVKSASTRANELISLYSHYRPNGKYYVSVLDESGVSYSSYVEAIFSEQTNPENLVDILMSSKSTRTYALDADYTSIGSGVAMDEDGMLYWALLFIRQQS